MPIRMRLIRAQKHLSQADVAKRFGLSQQAYASSKGPAQTSSCAPSNKWKAPSTRSFCSWRATGV